MIGLETVLGGASTRGAGDSEETNNMGDGNDGGLELYPGRPCPCCGCAPCCGPRGDCTGGQEAFRDRPDVAARFMMDQNLREENRPPEYGETLQRYVDFIERKPVHFWECKCEGAPSERRWKMKTGQAGPWGRWNALTGRNSIAQDFRRNVRDDERRGRDVAGVGGVVPAAGAGAAAAAGGGPATGAGGHVAGGAAGRRRRREPDPERNELVEFLTEHGLGAIAARFCERIGGMTRVRQFQNLQERDILEDPDLNFLRDWHRRELLRLVADLTAVAIATREDQGTPPPHLQDGGNDDVHTPPADAHDGGNDDDQGQAGLSQGP